MNDSLGFGQSHAACARRALKGPGYAYEAGFHEVCGALTVSPKSLDGYNSEFFQWNAGRFRPRIAALVRNDANDPGGTHGGSLRELT